MHVLPNGHAIYCAWNTDNGGPQRVSSVQSTFKHLRSKYPQAKVYASTFEQFYDAASADPATMRGLKVVTQEIGDTWLYVRSLDRPRRSHPSSPPSPSHAVVKRSGHARRFSSLPPH